MRANAVPISVMILSLLMASEAVAAPKLLAVLPLDARNASAKMDTAAKASLEDALRDEAANALSSAGWSVLTGENTYALLRDNGVDPATCGAGECHVSTARELNVEVFISGVVHYVDDQLVASVRLMETKTGRILSSERLEAPNTMGLRHAFEARAARFFARAGLTGGSAEKAPAAAWVQIRVMPAKAAITVDRMPASAGRQGPFSAGPHTVRGELEGYVPAEQSVELTNEAVKEVSLELKALPGRVRVALNVDAECESAGVRAKGGVERPAVLEVPAGAAHVVCRSPGHSDAIADVTAVPGSEVVTSLTLAASSPKSVEQVNLSLPPRTSETTLPLPVAPDSSRKTWGWVAIGAAALVTAASVAFDVKASSSNDRRLTAIDFLPVSGYAVAIGLAGVGIYNVGSR
jgi:TolB-like protein